MRIQRSLVKARALGSIKATTIIALVESLNSEIPFNHQLIVEAPFNAPPPLGSPTKDQHTLEVLSKDH